MCVCVCVCLSQTKSLFWTDYEKVTKSDKLYTSAAVLAAITIHPIKDPNIMLRVHQYLEEVRLRRLMNNVRKVQTGISRVSHLVPQNLTHFKLRQRQV